MATIKELELQIAKLTERLAAVEDQLANQPKPRNRGPASNGAMTTEMAERMMIGDLRNTSNNQAAIILGLSYGQIFSARKGYTFKPVYKKMVNKEFVGEPLTAEQIADLIHEMQSPTQEDGE